jgi:hypothetical protein
VGICMFSKKYTTQQQQQQQHQSHTWSQA